MGVTPRSFLSQSAFAGLASMFPVAAEMSQDFKSDPVLGVLLARENVINRDGLRRKWIHVATTYEVDLTKEINVKAIRTLRVSALLKFAQRLKEEFVVRHGPDAFGWKLIVLGKNWMRESHMRCSGPICEPMSRVVKLFEVEESCTELDEAGNKEKFWIDCSCYFEKAS